MNLQHINFMRKCQKKMLAGVLVCLFVTVAMVIIAAFTFKPFGKAVFSIVAGSVYRKVGAASLEANDYPCMLAIYIAKNKPFLLVGPCLFHGNEEECEDFFFVNKTQVIRSSSDKGGDIWYCIFNRLYILDDFSDCECLRAPFWDDIKCSQNSSVCYDGMMDSFIFSFGINVDSTPTKLTIPAKYFTPDMIDAPNRTLLK